MLQFIRKLTEILDQKAKQILVKFERHCIKTCTETYVLAARLISSVLLASPLFNVEGVLDKDPGN